MSNDDYILQLRDLDTNASNPTIDQSVIGVSDQQASKQKPKPNYKIQAGFVYEESTAPFTFSISPTVISFGTLSPTNPITRTNKLSVLNGSANGYSVIGFEDGELSASTKSELPSATSGSLTSSDVGSPSALIPDTSCDNGLCSEVSSAPWTSVLTYGFGYRCDSVIDSSCVKGFYDLNFYKQFANNSKSEIPQRILSGTNDKKKKIVQITYKVNISATQAKGSYQNIITYIAIPNF